jgi:hypothetical protein
VLARVLSAAVLGIDAYLVSVEADVASGLPQFSTVGLPQGAVKEGRERVVAAVQNSGYAIPPRRLTVNLAPAGTTTPSSGSALGMDAPGSVARLIQTAASGGGYDVSVCLSSVGRHRFECPTAEADRTPAVPRRPGALGVLATAPPLGS